MAKPQLDFNYPAGKVVVELAVTEIEQQGLTLVPGRERGKSYALEILSLSKRFRRATQRSGYTTLKSSILGLLFRKNRGPENFTHAISDLTLRIPRGSSVGIIGRNGSGKSTLLKLITGIYKPDHGSVTVHGRVSALIERGAGFHPDFTGRENVYLGGVMHGLSKAEIDERFDQIVKFAELEQVIDDPVRTYSSGMFMRLGFSLAIHTDPDVLLVDEVLAVGDAAFVAKCKERIARLRKEGKTLLLVTHDLDAVERWCDEAVWLHEGAARDRGEPRRVIDHYREFLEKGEEAELKEDALQEAVSHADPKDEKGDQKARWGGREVEITGVRMLNAKGAEHLLYHADDATRIEVDFAMREPVTDIVFGIGLTRVDGLLVYGTNTDIERVKFDNVPAKGTISFDIKRLGLIEGRYCIDVAVHKQDGYPYDYHKGVLEFAVRSPHPQVGVYAPEHTWELRS